MSREKVAELVAALDLARHPEGGWYRETFRDRPPGGGRGALTQIFYLLPAGEVSAWHRVIDATEVWHHYAGAPLVLSVSADAETVVDHTLGPDVAAGQVPHAVILPGCWQGARSLGAWTLCGCTVAPAFEFAGFELAPTGWQPGRRDRPE